MVFNGAITGWGTGCIVNADGKATMTMVIAPYGNLTFTSNFLHGATAGVTNLDGIVTGSFPSVLPKAQMGKKCAGYSLCQPPTPAGVV